MYQRLSDRLDRQMANPRSRLGRYPLLANTQAACPSTLPGSPHYVDVVEPHHKRRPFVEIASCEPLTIEYLSSDSYTAPSVSTAATPRTSPAMDDDGGSTPRANQAQQPLDQMDLFQRFRQQPEATAEFVAERNNHNPRLFYGAPMPNWESCVDGEDGENYPSLF